MVGRGDGGEEWNGDCGGYSYLCGSNRCSNSLGKSESGITLSKVIK